MRKILGLLVFLFSLMACQTPGRAPAKAPTGSGPEIALFNAASFAVVTTDELRTKYDRLMAVSDIHGSLDRWMKLMKAQALITADSDRDGFHWNPAAKRVLLVVTGDSINKGPDSVRVILRLRDLQTDASQYQSRVIVLLGNHDADFLGDPKNETSKEMLKSAEGIPDLQIGKKLSGKDIAKGYIGDFMRTMKVGAVVGSWVFFHSGYLATLGEKLDSPAAAHAHAVKVFSRMHAQLSAGQYYEMNNPQISVLSAHDWYKKNREATWNVLQSVGLTGMVIGHEPGALGLSGSLGINTDRWLMKIDAGMNPEADDSEGFLLQCNVAELVAAATAANTIAMVDASGAPLCRQAGPHGNPSPIPVQK